jgi:hypothetical protein
LEGDRQKCGATSKTLNVVTLVLLLAAMVHAYVTRKETKPPKWMGTHETAEPKHAFRLGFLLLRCSDRHLHLGGGWFLPGAPSDPWWHGTPFIGLTLRLLGLSALILLAFGCRAEAFLPRAREWMTTNAWIVNEIALPSSPP